LACWVAGEADHIKAGRAAPSDGPAASWKRPQQKNEPTRDL